MTYEIDWPTMKRRYVGKQYRRRVNGKQVTRFVYDVNLGGDVWVREGDSRRYRGIEKLIPQAKWREWVKDAKRV